MLASTLVFFLQEREQIFVINSNLPLGGGGEGGGGIKLPSELKEDREEKREEKRREGDEENSVFKVKE